MINETSIDGKNFFKFKKLLSFVILLYILIISFVGTYFFVATFIYTQLTRNSTLSLFGHHLKLYDLGSIKENDLLLKKHTLSSDTFEALFGVLYVQYGIKIIYQAKKWFQELSIFNDVYNYINKNVIDNKIYFSQYLRYVKSPLANHIVDHVLPDYDPNNISKQMPSEIIDYWDQHPKV